MTFTPSPAVMLSCGHVEANLAAHSVQEVKEAMELIQAGAIVPVNVEDQYGEFNVNNYTIILSMKSLHKS